LCIQDWYYKERIHFYYLHLVYQCFLPQNTPHSLLHQNPDYFSKGRGANILKSIKEDYKNETGLELDVNKDKSTIQSI
jgi:hypothetical protein